MVCTKELCILFKILLSMTITYVLVNDFPPRYHSEANVTVSNSSIYVMEGNNASVCVQLSSDVVSTIVGCDLTISLSTNDGKASMCFP